MAAGKRFLIADASSLIFRGAFAIKAKDPNYNGGWSLLSHFAFLWNQISDVIDNIYPYSLCRTVFRKIEELNPTHVCIAGDGYQSSHKRREILNNYKAHRPDPGDNIKFQLENVSKLCNIMKIIFASQELYEADDVINTFVKQAIDKNFE